MWFRRAETVEKLFEKAVGEGEGARERLVVVAVERPGIELQGRGRGQHRVGTEGELQSTGRSALVCSMGP